MRTLGTSCLYLSLLAFHTFLHFAASISPQYNAPNGGQLLLTIIVAAPVFLAARYMSKRFPVDDGGMVARPSRRAGVEIMLLVILNAAPRLLGAEAWQHSRLLALFLAVGACYVGVFVYGLYFAYAPERGRGFWFGVLMMPGLFSKPLFEWLIAPVTPGTFHLAYTGLTLCSLMLIPFIFGALLLAAPPERPESRQLRAPEAEGIAVRVGLICLIIYFVNGLLYDKLFINYTIRAVESKPAPLYFLAVLFCPVIGWLAEKDSGKWFPRLLIIVAALWLAAPAVAGLIDSSRLFFTVGTLATGGVFLLFIASTVILSRLASSSPKWALIVCVPFLCRFAVLPGLAVSRHINTETLVLISICAAALLYHLAHRLFLVRHYPAPAFEGPASAIPLAAYAPAIAINRGAPEPVEKTSGAESSSNAATAETLFDQHKLTSREREVAESLVRGKTTPQIAASLNISERTVHYHTQNVLRKFDVPNRMAFVVKFMGSNN